MKKLLLLILPLLLVACQSSSYYSAMNKNKQRFDGWQEENAIFLAETHDKIQLIEDLSELAKKESNLRTTFQLAEKIETEMADLKTYYQVEATIHRIKLASALSEPGDKVLQKIETISKENFDSVYLRYVNSELDELDSMMNQYQKEGHNERIRSLADRVGEVIEDLIEQNKEIS